MALALEYFRSMPRYVGSKVAGRRVRGWWPAGRSRRSGSSTQPDPEPRGEGWARVKPALAGICGSDLSTIAGESRSTSRRWSRCRSCPGTRSWASCWTTAAIRGRSAGDVLVSVSAARRAAGRAVRELRGRRVRTVRPRDGRFDLKAGLQTGYCTEHRRRMEPHDGRPPVAAVGGPGRDRRRRRGAVEPLACAIHSVLRARAPKARVSSSARARSASSRRSRSAGSPQPGHVVIVAAKHPAQRAAARLAGADEVVRPEHAARRCAGSDTP